MFIKKSTFAKLGYTLLIYVGIYILAATLYYAFKMLTFFNVEEQYLYTLGGEPMALMSIYLIYGGISFLGAVEFLVFPFFPFLFINTIIYLFVRHFHTPERVGRLKRFVKYFLLTVFVIFIIAVGYGKYLKYVANTEQNKQDVYFWEKYGAEEDVKLAYRLIDIGNDAIYI